LLHLVLLEMESLLLKIRLVLLPLKKNDFFYHGRFLWYKEETFFATTDAFSMKSKTRLKSHGRMVYDGPPIFMVFSKSTTEWQLLLMWFGRPQRDDVITKLTMM
jgi:hypothetical protein